MSEFGEFAKGCRDTRDVLQEVLEAIERIDGRRKLVCAECHILYRRSTSTAANPERFCTAECEDANA